jgi:ABC-type antimicrobial peptide transport system permease subunit
MKWVVRTSSNEPGLERAMQDALRAVDPALPFVRVHPMSDVVAQDVDMQRLMAGLVATFALVATLLAAVGLYGLIAHSVRQRTREVGIRMAFGATGVRIVSAFMAEGVGLALFGLTIGLAAAGLVTEVLAARLYGVEPLDGPTFVAAAALLLAVAAVATFVPAARASRTNPVEALRS